MLQDNEKSRDKKGKEIRNSMVVTKARRNTKSRRKIRNNYDDDAGRK